ncbi:MAG: tripartite tricarboxylate transporter substrate binding protein [Comamonadaceae bacterium]|nr:MAG: tripartite tricarboxylate transporter substrate binding protein [Comamonadaceae bacterium]
MTLSRRTLLRSLASSGAAAAMGAPTGAWAQEFPTRPIKVVIPFPAGSVGDVLMRAVQVRTADTPYNFVIDNKPGGNTFIAMGIVANSPPDGYTMAGSTISTDVINPMVYNKLPYDPESLVPLSLLGYSPYVVVVPAEFPANTLAQLIEMAKAKPGSLNFGSAGIGNSTHLVTEKLMREANIKMTHVPFNGAQPVHQALLRGDVQVYSDVLTSALPQVRAGKFKLLAITSDKRHPVVPNVPTMIESGFPEFVLTAWYGLQVPRRTPQDAIDKLGKVLGKALTDPGMIAEFDKRGMVLFPQSGPKAHAQMIALDRERWGTVIKALNLKLES